MATNAAMPVPSPPFTPAQFGLWSVVEDRSAIVTDPHWRNGVKWYELCGMGQTTFNDCHGELVDTDATDKTANVTINWHRATQFAPYVEIDCSPVGNDVAEREAMAAEALGRVEAFQVERAFWTGKAEGNLAQVYPHLAASTATLDTSEVVTITLQCAATAVSGSIALDVVEGFGRLEAAMAACLAGRGVIHVPMILGEQLFRANIVEANGNQLRTRMGNLVAVGAGYLGSGPDGTLPSAAATWIYGTGPVFGYRGDKIQFRYRDSFDRSENTAKMIAERPYVVGFSCCCMFAEFVSVGGIVTGVPLAAG